MIWIGLAIVVVTFYLIYKNYEARLVLALSGLVMAVNFVDPRQNGLCCSSNSSFVLSLVACSRCNEKEKFCTASCVVCCAALGRQGANRCTGKMAAIEFDSFLPKIVAECLINSNHMVYQFFE